MALEIERTFLVKKLPRDLKKYKSKKVKQGYISDLPFPLRIRQFGEKYELTKKLIVDNNPSLHEETNVTLTEREFRKRWSSVTKFLEKKRYFIPLDRGLTAELDVFEGKLAGHTAVEVEFSSRRQRDSFVPPKWFGRDITLDDLASNLFLAGKSFAEIKKYLKNG